MYGISSARLATLSRLGLVEFDFILLLYFFWLKTVGNLRCQLSETRNRNRNWNRNRTCGCDLKCVACAHIWLHLRHDKTKKKNRKRRGIAPIANYSHFSIESEAQTWKRDTNRGRKNIVTSIVIYVKRGQTLCLGSVFYLWSLSRHCDCKLSSASGHSWATFTRVHYGSDRCFGCCCCRWLPKGRLHNGADGSFDIASNQIWYCRIERVIQYAHNAAPAANLQLPTMSRLRLCFHN